MQQLDVFLCSGSSCQRIYQAVPDATITAAKGMGQSSIDSFSLARPGRETVRPAQAQRRYLRAALSFLRVGQTLTSSVITFSASRT